MESLLCNEVWLMSPNNALLDNNNNNNNVQEIFSTKEEDCEEALGIFLGKEATYMPESGYLKFVKNNHIIHNARFKAVNRIVKSQSRMINFSPGTAFLAVNYLDRFISLTQCQGWKNWTFELLSVACLSIAFKFNETTTCLLLHELFQAEGVDNCFAPTLIERMELTVLKALGWRMDSTTPFSYVHFLIQSMDNALNSALVEDLTKRVTQLLLTALLDPEFLEFQQCVMAMSAVRCVFEDLFPSINNASSLEHLDTVMIPQQDQKDDLIKCQRIMVKLLVQDHKMFGCGKNSWHGSSSPVTVLKVELFDFYNYPVGLSFDLRSDRKRKREELECAGAVN